MAPAASVAPARWRWHRPGPTWRSARARPASTPPRTFAAVFGTWVAGRRPIRSTLRCASDLETMCARVKSDFEAVDILVNNAGVTRDRSFRKMDRNAWDEVINVNLSSVFDVTRMFIDAMVARGWGRVINISSIVGRIGNIGQSNYAAAKAGLIGLTKTLAREYARKG